MDGIIRYRLESPEWPCTASAFPRQFVAIDHSSDGTRFVLLTDEAVWLIDLQGIHIVMQRLLQTGGKFLSVSPSGGTIFLAQSNLRLTVLSTTPSTRSLTFDCIETITAMAALSDTAALVALESSLVVLFASDNVMSASAFLYQLSASTTPGVRWNVPVEQALFLQVTALVALPLGPHKWRIVGHDRIIRRVFTFDLRCKPNTTSWSGGTVRTLTGDGSVGLPFGHFLRLERTAVPMVVGVSAWARSSSRRNLLALNCINGNACKVCTFNDPAVTALGIGGTVYHATVTGLVMSHNTLAPSAAVKERWRYWRQCDHRQMTKRQQTAVLNFFLAMYRQNDTFPIELMHLVLHFVPSDTLGRPIAIYACQ